MLWVVVLVGLLIPCGEEGLGRLGVGECFIGIMV